MVHVFATIQLLVEQKVLFSKQAVWQRLGPFLRANRKITKRLEATSELLTSRYTSMHSQALVHIINFSLYTRSNQYLKLLTLSLCFLNTLHQFMPQWKENKFKPKWNVCTNKWKTPQPFFSKETSFTVRGKKRQDFCFCAPLDALLLFFLHIYI